MATFGGTFTASQGPDPKNILFTDERNWDDNDQDYERGDFVRSLELKDSEGDTITTLIFSEDSDIVNYTIDENTNPWIDATLTTTGTPNLPTLEKKFPLQRYFDLAYTGLKVESCGDGCGTHVDLSKVNFFLKNSEYAAVQGDAIAYQSNIDIAYKLVTQ